jgi:cytochrome c-type biogenesis protein CcmH/NrfG
MESLRHAIELDPTYAAAYAALAETFYTSVSMGWVESPTDFLSRAEEMANKAVSIDDAEVRARIVLGRIDIFITATTRRGSRWTVRSPSIRTMPTASPAAAMP